MKIEKEGGKLEVSKLFHMVRQNACFGWHVPFHLHMKMLDVL